MSDRSNCLTAADRAWLAAVLTAVQCELDAAGEMLAAVHVAHALECLEPPEWQRRPVGRCQSRGFVDYGRSSKSDASRSNALARR